jgi:hypothetical protein
MNAQRLGGVMASEALVRQRQKIQQIGEALVTVGLTCLKQQAAALGIVRSTAWSILQAKHKKSGLSTDVAIRMLSAPQLPPTVRTIILEYVEEKCAGLYGHNDKQLGRFTAKLSRNGLAAVIPRQCRGKAPKLKGVDIKSTTKQSR